MGLKELFKGSRKEKGFAQTRPLQEILKDLVQEDASVTVSENGVNVILQGYMKDNTCWMHKLQYLPKYAKVELTIKKAVIMNWNTGYVKKTFLSGSRRMRKSYLKWI